jgi:hypothetical protein
MSVGKEPRKAMKLDLPTRRGVLRNRGCLLGGALLLPSSLPKALWGEEHQAAKRVSNVMKTLSDYMAGARLTSLPASIQEATKFLTTLSPLVQASLIPWT